MSSYEENIKKLDSLSGLKLDWNSYGALPISPLIIDTVKNLLTLLPYQPNVYPTTSEGIQLEFEKDTGEYLEIEINGFGYSFLYIEKKDGKEIETEVIISSIDLIKAIIIMVDKFYDNTLSIDWIEKNILIYINNEYIKKDILENFKKTIDNIDEKIKNKLNNQFLSSKDRELLKEISDITGLHLARLMAGIAQQFVIVNANIESLKDKKNG